MSDFSLTTTVKVEIFPDHISKLIDSPSGPVGVSVNGIANQVLQAAIPLIGPRGYSGTTGKPKEARSAPLNQSGSVVSVGGANWSVVFTHPIATIHHNGAGPHTIGNKGQKLHNPKLQPPFAARGPVQHPGSHANPFLITAAAQLGLRASGGLKRGTAAPTPIFRAKNFF